MHTGEVIPASLEQGRPPSCPLPLRMVSWLWQTTPERKSSIRNNCWWSREQGWTLNRLCKSTASWICPAVWVLPPTTPSYGRMLGMLKLRWVWKLTAQIHRKASQGPLNTWPSWPGALPLAPARTGEAFAVSYEQLWSVTHPCQKLYHQHSLLWSQMPKNWKSTPKRQREVAHTKHVDAMSVVCISDSFVQLV